MKCSGCGEDFPNLARLKEHKLMCPAETSTETKQEAQGKELLIPLDLCPDELKYYAEGKTLGLRITGKLTDDGVLVQEVTLIR